MAYIFTYKAPQPVAYSQAVSVDAGDCTLIFLSGQTDNIPEGTEPVIRGGLGPQTTQALRNILAVVEEAGGTIHDIVELKVFLKDSEGIGGAKNEARTLSRNKFGTAYMAFFAKYGMSKETKNLPARTMVWVSEVPLEYPTEDTLVEITAIAAIPKKEK